MEPGPPPLHLSVETAPLGGLTGILHGVLGIPATPDCAAVDHASGRTVATADGARGPQDVALAARS